MKKIIGLIFCAKAFDLRRGVSDGSRACSEEDQDRKSLCESVCSEVVGACVTKCGGFDGDQSCVSVCKREGWECVDECPCNDNCSDGCVGCDNWACKDDNILVMNKAINDVVIFSPTGENGQTMVADGFVYEMNTGVDASCSVLYNGRMLVFGGYESKSYAKQISEVVKSPKCKLSPVGTLPLKFAFGACNVVDNKVLLCFAEGVENECDSFDGQQITREASSKYMHGVTSLGVYQNSAIAIGAISHQRVESYQNAQWKDMADFPFTQQGIYRYSVVNFKGDLYLFGGESGGVRIDVAAKYDGRSWENVGNLKQARSGHRSLANQDSITHIGGRTSMRFEEWIPEGSGFRVKESKDTISYYYDYPESFYVPYDYVAYCLPKRPTG